ncbi:MFS transporter [Termitidicoccus mucosus]|uniref:Sodium:melibiose symporter n=1 Tax=Termitidicoccus mucosus TaxID=1184151 RepID=A0A178IPF1_9BACT|nr:hypothetical protein AW736_02355 [Opitutaceae bacterium TSB47]
MTSPRQDSVAPPHPDSPGQPQPAHASPEKLQPRSLFAYGLGVIAYQYPHTGLAMLAMPLLNVELGVSPATVGAILMIGRIWDAITNPLMGAISDNTRTKWGRRRPYLVLGAILCALTYPLVWWVPEGASHAVLAIQFLVTTLLLYTFFAIYSVPYMALGLELSPDYHERTRVQVWRSYIGLIPMLTAGGFYWFCQRPFFGGTVAGARWLGLLVGLVILVTGVMPGLLLRERYYRLSVRQEREPLMTQWRAAVTNRPFIILMGIIASLTIGWQTTDALGFYVMTYHVFGGDTVATGKLLFLTTVVVTAFAFVAIPIVRRIELRFGKTRALRVCLYLNITAAISKWFLASPAHPWTWLIIGILAQFCSLGFWILVSSMKADICDHDELHSGRRREGTFGAIGNLVQKFTGSLTYFLGGLLLSLIGYDAALGGAQNPESIFWLRVCFSLGPILFLSLCLVLLNKYPLDEPAMKAIRSQLEQRRSQV